MKTVGASHTQWTAVLLCVAFLACQTITETHVHAGDGAPASCTVCSHADNTPVVHSAALVLHQTRPADPQYEHAWRQQCAARPGGYRSRAPPGA